jgi:hypothetical protein
VADVIVAPSAWIALDELIATRSLPGQARSRVVATIMALAVFPERGRRLPGRWSGFRYVLGPWPWMLLVYEYEPSTEVVAVVSIQDARAIGAATGSG